MRVAFISYEFPPETGGGGIGTYLNQITGALSVAGHDVAVFAGGSADAITRREDGVVVHRVTCNSSPEFGAAVVGAFSKSHSDIPFDVVEGNDFDASALGVIERLPDLAYVCKLHTPRFVVDSLQYRPSPWRARLRMILGALRRGRRPPSFSPASPWDTPLARAERAAIARADVIAAPSQAIAQAAARWVPGCEERVQVFPYPFVPSPALLAIPADTRTARITYLGRLEERKGVLDLATAIPLVLARHPEARFRFVGRVMLSPDGVPLDHLIQAKLEQAKIAVDFIGVQPPENIPRLLAETDLLVAPSHWESFGLVCCEGLAAARGVVASSAGGMAEILDQGAYGLLVPPNSPVQLADAICRLLTHPDERRRLGEAGRLRILDHYAMNRVLPAQLVCYKAAIANCCNRRNA